MNFTEIPSIRSILFLFIWGFSNVALSQTLTSEIYTKLPSSDQKKLQKAAELDSKGKSIEDEATQILSTGSNESDQTKNAKKYYQKLIEASKYYRERNSVQYKIYEGNIKAFWKKYKGDKKGLNSAYATETVAADSFKRAAELRFMADKASELPAKFTLIAKARYFENVSLQMLQKILYVYLNWPIEYNPEWLNANNMDFPSAYKKKDGESAPTQPINITDIDTMENENDSSLYTIVRVNEEQIDMFNEFLKRTYPANFEDYIINFPRLQFSDIESIRSAWYAYLYNNGPGESQQMLATVQNSTSNAQTTDVSNQTSAANTIQSSSGKKSANTSTQSPSGSGSQNKTKTSSTGSLSEPTNQPSSSTSGPQNKIGIAGPSTGNLTDNSNQPSSALGSATKNTASKSKNEAGATNYADQSNAGKNASSDKGQTNVVSTGKVISHTPGNAVNGTNSLFTFRVQIAACRVKLDGQTLRGIYDGPEDIRELYEDSWYKYSVGEYPSYLAARNLRNQLQIPGAFVTAYLKGRRINATPFHPNKRTLGARIARGMSPKLIEFRLQIAACKTPLSEQFLQNIYNGEKTIDTIYEEGWYKYSLLAGKTIKEALCLLKQASVPGAFIVAYHQNIKLDLYEAIRFTKRFNQ